MNRDCFARKTAQPIPNPCSSVLQTIGMLLCRDDFPNFTQRRKGAKHWIFLCAFAPLREHSLVAALPRCALRGLRGEFSHRLTVSCLFDRLACSRSAMIINTSSVCTPTSIACQGLRLPREIPPMPV